MRKLKCHFIFLCLLIANLSLFGNDTLSLERYLEVVSLNYPLIKKANLYNEMSEAILLKGRGVLDPKIYSDLDRKRFKDTKYFQVWQSEVKVPTTLPIDFSVGYERNNGEFLNSENNVSDNGLVYGTLNLSLLRGLMFDEQRFEIQNADLKSLKSQNDRKLLTREILSQAVEHYLQWSTSYYKNQVLENYLEAITMRHANVIALYQSGDKPAIDTLESKISLNTANQKYLLSSQELFAKRQKINLFLWNENEQALELVSEVKPNSLESFIEKFDRLSVDLINDFSNDPLLRKIEIDTDQIELERKLQLENLKPRLDLKYNGIVDLGKDRVVASYSANDYKYGVAFELPVRNRKSRGELRMSEVLIEQNNYDKQLYSQELQLKFETLLVNREILENNVEISQEKIRNSELLTEAENLKFDLGDSSFFMINLRERKLLDARIELIERYKDLGGILGGLYYLSLGQMD